jgi:uncharacterized protein (TIGR01777 family)
VALSRSKSGRADGVDWVPGTPDDLPRWEARVSGCDAIVNLAGEPVAKRWTRTRVERIIRSRVGVTTALYHAIDHAETRPAVLVNASAVGYYGTDPERTFDETAEAGDGFLAGVCTEWEAAAVRCEQLGLRVVRLRIGMVLAAEGGALPQLIGPVPFFVGGALGSGEQWVSWVHADDLVALILHAVDTTTISGPVNAVAPEPLQQRALAKTLSRVTGRRVWLDAPGFLLSAALGKMAGEMLLSGQRVVPSRAVESGFQFRYADAESALRAELGRGR